MNDGYDTKPACIETFNDVRAQSEFSKIVLYGETSPLRIHHYLETRRNMGPQK